jgi:peptide/nickel transport system ATP-binding protein/oligopeptide transport system ATP-binding protein
MYLGRIVETGDAARIFAEPRHPYTRALLMAIPVPSPESRRGRPLLEGDPPSPIAPPPGCHLHTRCPHAAEACRQLVPELTDAGDCHAVACHFWRDIRSSALPLPQERPFPPHVERLIKAFEAAR